MSADDRNNGSGKDIPPESSASPKPGSETVREALDSTTDKPLPPLAEAIAERDAERPHPVTPQAPPPFP